MYIMDELEREGFKLDFSLRLGLNEDRSNRDYYSYDFIDTDTGVRFNGSDFSPSPLCKTEEERIIGLLEFLICEPENDPQEVFEDYTSNQLNWAKSHRRQDLAYIVWEFDNKTIEK